MPEPHISIWRRLWSVDFDLHGRYTERESAAVPVKADRFYGLGYGPNLHAAWDAAMSVCRTVDQEGKRNKGKNCESVPRTFRYPVAQECRSTAEAWPGRIESGY
jgi:hypothetical protein